MAPPPTPAVTAITIFLNEETFLADAVESVLAQSNRDWELLLVDGEGEDAKLICESWSRTVTGSGERHEITAAGSLMVAVGFV